MLLENCTERVVGPFEASVYVNLATRYVSKEKDKGGLFQMILFTLAPGSTFDLSKVQACAIHQLAELYKCLLTRHRLMRNASNLVIQEAFRG